MTALAALFDRAAMTYDRERRMLLPDFDAFYGAALAPLVASKAGARVLDLGAGTGLLAGMLAAKRPDLQLTLTDVSPGMLDRARERFAALGGAEPVFAAGDYTEALPQGPFDAVMSALSIHHVADAEKQALFRRIRAALVPGGVFVNAEQVAGATAGEEARLDAEWEAAARRLGADDGMIGPARERMAHDQCATLDEQLAWLREAGFAAAECAWQEGRFAVLIAR
ncbi:MAG: class I SAM-dependent methyltransferase [Pseudomonadota bacterium]